MASRLTLVILAVSLVALGCGNPPPSAPARRVLLPESGGNTTMTAQVFGRLAGDATTGCVWFVGKDGAAYTALWPRGYTALFGPVRVLDNTGSVVGVEGQILTMTGGILPAGNILCRVGPMAFIIGQVDGRLDAFP